jgi:hypothetical protein
VVTGRELWSPERIDEVDDSERKDNVALRTIRILAAKMLSPSAIHSSGSVRRPLRPHLRWDSVDLSSGSITITLPLRNKAGKLPFSLGLVANSVAHLTTNAQGKTAWGVPTGLRPEVLTTNFGASVGYSTNAHYLCGSTYGSLYYSFFVTFKVEIVKAGSPRCEEFMRYFRGEKRGQPLTGNL